MNIKKIIFKNTESTLYFMGILVVLIVMAVYLPIEFLIEKSGFNFPQICFFRHLTGLYCPGCGGTRSVLFLLHGNIVDSFIYNPFAMFCCIIGCIFYTTQTLSYLTRGWIRGLRFRKGYIYVGVFLLVTNFVIKNILLIFWGIRLIE